MTKIAQGAFHILQPGVQENFYPAEADPTGNITCPDEGDLQYLRLPTITSPDGGRTVNPGTLTLQQLCAKPQYGGWGEGLHLGGFCYTGRNGRAVNFDTTPPARVSSHLTSPRLLLYCQTRCFCNNPPSSPQQRRENFYPRLNTGPIGFDAAGDISPSLYRLEKKPFLEGAWLSSLARTSRRFIFVNVRSQLFYQQERANIILRIGRYPPTPLTPQPFFPRTAAVGLDDSNNIECEGPLPDWPLPIPNEWQAAVNTDPLSIRGLCSASLLGGNPSVLLKPPIYTPRSLKC